MHISGDSRHAISGAVVAPSATPSPEKPGSAGSLDMAIESCRGYLLSQQHEDGHWCGELEGDTILESEYFLTLYFLYRSITPRMRKAAEYVRRRQLAQGAWAIYPGGRSEVSASAKAYFVLKLVGDDAAAPHMRRARAVIRELGGLDACNSFTKIYLAMFGQYPWDACPMVPPELVLLPPWAPLSIYRMSNWTRAIVVPLSILRAARPHCPVPPSAGISELRVARAAGERRAQGARSAAWRAFFIGLDRLLARLEKLPAKPLRRIALERCEQWIVERLDDSEGLGAIFPPIINTLIAFWCLGYGLEHPRMRGQLEELERLTIEEDDTLRVQPCRSAVWDTALAVHALAASGSAPDDPALLAGARFLLEHEVKRPGDAAITRPSLPVGGWYFQYANEPNPDTDDTAEALLALSHVRFRDSGEEARRRAAIARGTAWQLAMQSRDGGWGAFDRDCDSEMLTNAPFADHNAMIDPSSEDITGRTLEALSRLDYARASAVRRAITFLKRKQRADGTWYGRWGCNYIYGTWLALRGLAAVGVDVRAPRFLRAREWFFAHQNEDGGWGELPDSYDDPGASGIGPSTPSQTAWALLALSSLGELESPAARRGVAYLLATQQVDGSWRDATWTGTGFPRVFYLRYHLYATYFPLWALAEAQRAYCGPATPAERSNVHAFRRKEMA